MNVAIVGGGVAGLTAACEAAAEGASVTVFDARRTLGGRARTHRRDGFLLNEGAHALYEGGPAMAYLKELGIEPAGGTPNAGNGIGVDGDVVGRFPVGLWSLLRTPLLKGDRLAMLKLFAALPKLDPSKYANKTVAEAMTELLGTGTAARFGEALIRLSSYGNDPHHASADIGLVQLKMALATNVRYLDNGWQAIVDGLLATAVGRGVAVRTEAKVGGVGQTGPVDSEGPIELLVDGEVLRFDSVILAAGGPQHADRLLGGTNHEVAAMAADARPATVSCLDVGLSGPWGDHPTFALGIDEPLYLSVHAPVADLAPDGQSLVHVMRYHNPDETQTEHTADARSDRAACEQLLDRVRPGWRSDAIHVGFSSRLVAASDQPAAAKGGLSGRPAVAVKSAPGLFLAGDWVGDVGALVDASVASGRAAGRAAAKLTTRDGALR